MAARPVFSTPTPADAEELALQLRAADRREIIASIGPDVPGTIRRSVELSTLCWSVRAPEGLLCIFGAAPVSVLGDVASPWLLGTPLLVRHSRTLIAVSPSYIAQMRDAYPTLVNFVDDRNSASIRFLRWLGFEIGEPEPFGVEGRPFRRFELRGE